MLIVALFPNTDDVVVGARNDVKPVVADRQMVDDHLFRLQRGDTKSIES